MVDPTPTITSGGQTYSAADGTLMPTSGSDINAISFYENATTDEAFTNLILEDIGGRELITLARHQTLSGSVVVKNSPIQNLASVLFKNSSVNVAPNINSMTDYFDIFPIKLSQYLPTLEQLQSENASEYQQSFVYFEPNTNTIVFNIANAFAGERVQVEFIVFDSLNDDTIYP